MPLVCDNADDFVPLRFGRRDPQQQTLPDRRLSRGPINRFAVALIVAVVLEGAAVIAGGFGPLQASSQFSPLLTTAGLASWLALGMVGATALIAVMIRLTKPPK